MRNSQLCGHEGVKSWVKEMIQLCRPDHVHFCDGSDGEMKELCDLMVAKGTFIPLNPNKRPNSYLARSHPNDVARVEDRTFICSEKQSDAGPTNNWADPDKMKALLTQRFNGSMQGRTMYVLAFSMGPTGSPLAHIGVQVTDSPYVVYSMNIMTRMGKPVWDQLKSDQPFVHCLHSVGMPLSAQVKDVPWSCNTEKYIVHFPQTQTIWSFGSGYGGNALVGKKSFALRLASVMGRDQHWMAEHMLILGMTNPKGEKKYITAAFPSGCGKTNLAMLNSTLPGWKFETVGDDIAWMKYDKNGILRAINPEAGFFGIASGTSYASNPNAMLSIQSNTIFTNVALTDDGDVWWEGMTEEPPEHLVDWLGQDWYRGSPNKAAHPNSRFTVPASQCPIIDNAWESPEGVPISAILFGGRRTSTVPLVCESYSWNHGVLLGASMSSETTAAASGEVGHLRHDPFAMLPFCGYNMGDYFNHWTEMGKEGGKQSLPKIYYVNWFRKNGQGQWLWPGFGENSRVLEWIFNRIDNKAEAVDKCIGWLPTPKALNMSSLSITPKAIDELLDVDKAAWANEVKETEKYLSQFEKLPKSLTEELDQLKNRLS